MQSPPSERVRERRVEKETIRETVYESALGCFTWGGDSGSRSEIEYVTDFRFRHCTLFLQTPSRVRFAIFRIRGSIEIRFTTRGETPHCSCDYRNSEKWTITPLDWSRSSSKRRGRQKKEIIGRSQRSSCILMPFNALLAQKSTDFNSGNTPS